ncbi:MAG: flagellar hook-associated protein FlgK [Gammaproteobacteria bacterium]|nr:flagellar hook-associated protein FlgK [Gammaproteobacteria bacterium]
MADALNIGLSGLLAAQRSLATTSHNISNVNTPGYSRQRTLQSAPMPDVFGNGFFGRGVQTNTTERIHDTFLETRLREAETEHGRLRSFDDFASQLDELLASEEGGLSVTLQGFFDALQEVSTNPSSIPARQVLLNEAENLSSRFKYIDRRVQAMDGDLNRRVETTVQDINTLAREIADLNEAIVLNSGRGGGNPPNDLLDQRENALRELSRLTRVSTVAQDDGALNVFIGNGQSLVVGKLASTLTTIPDADNPAILDVAYDLNGTQVPIGRLLQGGELGGLFDVHDQLLDAVGLELDRVATVLGETMNAQHRKGVDLNGDLGSDLFTITSGEIVHSTGNTGTATLSLNVTDYSALKAASYTMRYDGTNYSLVSDLDGSSVSGAGPSLSLDGFSVTVGAGAVAGDRFQIKPTGNGAEKLSVKLTDLSKVAVGAPLDVSAGSANVNSARLGSVVIDDAGNANLKRPVRLTFHESPASFDVVDVTSGTSLASGVAYTTGDTYSVNGWTLTIGQAPKEGDQFTVGPTVSASGDNRNADLMAQLRQQPLIEGRSDFQQTYASMVGRIGAVARQSHATTQAQARLTEQASAARESVSGVNLDEEAVNLARFQQSYQASAQVIQMGSSLFQTLIGVLRG